MDSTCYISSKWEEKICRYVLTNVHIKFRSLLQISCPNQLPKSNLSANGSFETLKTSENIILRGLGRVRNWNVFPKTILDKALQINSQY